MNDRQSPGDTRQREYIITEMQLKRILVLMNRDSVMDEDEFLDIVAELRSRPAASQPTGASKMKECFGTHDGRWDSCVACDINFECIKKQKYINDEITAIRNEVLDEVYNKIDGKRVCKWGESERCEVLDLVESFRTISTTGDKGGE